MLLVPWKITMPTLKAEIFKTIRWTSNHKVELLETQDGQTLYPTPAPGAGAYLLTAILPLLGFFVPWGAVLAIGWVGAGFVSGPK